MDHHENSMIFLFFYIGISPWKGSLLDKRYVIVESFSFRLTAQQYFYYQYRFTLPKPFAFVRPDSATLPSLEQPHRYALRRSIRRIFRW